MSKRLIVMVGPAGSGKSTMSRKFAEEGYTYINQDAQGRAHLALFEAAVVKGEDVVVDRMGFTKGQRSRYLDIANKYSYHTRIIVLHESYKVCLERCINRQGHETIKEESAARSALNMFFSKYERVEDSEANVVDRIWPKGDKPRAIISDLDGTLCLVEHRRHFVRREDGQKKDWKGFFEGMVRDTVNEPVMATLKKMEESFPIIYCSGRPDNYRKETEQWLKNNNAPEGHLFMRLRNDSRQDDIVKEILLDFEILTRVTPFLVLDDRDQVVVMWRKRGYNCFQVAPGDF